MVKIWIHSFQHGYTLLVGPEKHRQLELHMQSSRRWIGLAYKNPRHVRHMAQRSLEAKHANGGKSAQIT